jgi:putative flippase GtrA
VAGTAHKSRGVTTTLPDCFAAFWSWVLPSRRVLTFLCVGAAGYVVDVLAFNWLRGQPGLAGMDPTVSQVLAVGAAMVVTYLGNRMLTWRGGGSATERRREIALFVGFNLVGLAISVAVLVLSHDVLGLTSRLADNVSANVIGLGLGTAFRYWSYRAFVFAGPRGDSPVGVAGAQIPPALHSANEAMWEHGRGRETPVSS